jgi:hypothetical protein
MHAVKEEMYIQYMINAAFAKNTTTADCLLSDGTYLHARLVYLGHG